MPVPSGMHRRALVVGNSKYRNAPQLRNPANDAEAMATRLKDLGFEVSIEKDLDAQGFRRAISEFCQRLGEATQGGLSCAAVIFYAGHGVQVDGSNHLLPVDSQIGSKLDLKQQSIELDVVLEALGSVATSSVVLLDCCRQNPLPRTLGPASRSLATTQGLANVRAPKGVYVAFATQPHFVALDGAGDNSPFTESMLAHVSDRGSHISEVMMSVRREVYEKTGGQQIPWDHSALFEPFSFAPGAAVTRAEGMSEEEWQKQTKAELRAREDSYWQLVRQSKDLDFIRSFIVQFPNSEHQRAASARIDRLIMQRQRRRASGWALAGIAALIAVYFGQLFYRMQSLPDADIVSGDIEVQDGIPGIASSLLGCRLRCVADRFKRPCVSFSYDQKDSKCYPKYEAVFYEKPSKFGKNDVYSEVMPGVTLPTETSYAMFWDRGLVGEYSPPAAVQKAPGTARTLVEDVTLKRSYWVVNSGGACQRLCADLGKDCQGFTYTRVNSRCEVFRSVRSVVRDSVNRNPVHIPGTFSGFNECTDSQSPECAQAAARSGGAAAFRQNETVRGPGGSEAKATMPATGPEPSAATK